MYKQSKRKASTILAEGGKNCCFLLESSGGGSCGFLCVVLFMRGEGYDSSSLGEPITHHPSPNAPPPLFIWVKSHRSIRVRSVSIFFNALHRFLFCWWEKRGMQLSNLSSSQDCWNMTCQLPDNNQRGLVLSYPTYVPFHPSPHPSCFLPCACEAFHNPNPETIKNPPGLLERKKPNPQTSSFSFLRISFLFFFNQKPPLSMLHVHSTRWGLDIKQG